MKLPWNKKYLIISLHVVAAALVFFVLALAIGLFTFVMADFTNTIDVIGNVFGKIISVFSPLLVGLIIAYLLDPVASFFQKRYDIVYYAKIEPLLRNTKFYKKRKTKKTKYRTRTAGAVFSYLSVLLVILTFVGIFIIKIGSHSTDSFPDDVMAWIAATINDFQDAYAKIEVKLQEWGVLDYLTQYLTFFLSSISDLVKSVATNLFSFITTAGSGIINFLIALVVAFYFIKDKEFVFAKTTELLNLFVPRKASNSIHNFTGDIHKIFSGYIQGTLIDASIIAIIISLWLTIIGVNFSIVIGIISGFSNIIPYFGALVGFILAIVSALFSGDPIKALYAAIGIFAIQQIDGIFIQPKVVGQNVKLSPVLVLLSLSVAGSLFGLSGMIFAVPVCALFKLLAGRFVERKKQKAEMEETFADND